MASTSRLGAGAWGTGRVRAVTVRVAELRMSTGDVAKWIFTEGGSISMPGPPAS